MVGNIHSDAVTLYSVLLGSEDAGATWQEIHPRIRLSGLDHLQFMDADTGWARAGSIGTHLYFRGTALLHVNAVPLEHPFDGGRGLFALFPDGSRGVPSAVGSARNREKC